MQSEELFQKAYEIAKKAHKGQVDKCGVDYILHPFAVAQKCSSMESKIVAMLHDTIEDSPITAEDLLCAGFPEEIVHAVVLVTKEDGWNAKDYFSRIKANPLAREVKIADLEHNMDLSRFTKVGKTPSAGFMKKHEEYQKAYKYLKEEKIV